MVHSSRRLALLISRLPTLCEGTPKLLSSSDHIRFLSRALPSENRRKWRLLFTTARDGCSFTRFVGLTTHRAPCLLVIRDSTGAIFGGFAASPLAVAPQFAGSYGSFLFSLSPGAPAVHRASGDSPNLVYLNAGMDVLPNGLAFGGNLEALFFGLWLRDDLETGRSNGPCQAYSNSPCLASATEFKVDEIEASVPRPHTPYSRRFRRFPSGDTPASLSPHRGCARLPGDSARLQACSPR